MKSTKPPKTIRRRNIESSNNFFHFCCPDQKDGDSDTLAAITGGIAEAYYGIPDELREEVMDYLDDLPISILEEFEGAFQADQSRKDN